MLLQEGLFYIFKNKIPFLEELFTKTNKQELIKKYLRECGMNGRIKGQKFERFLAERLKTKGKIFLNVKFECEGQLYEYDIVTVFPNGDCDYYEVKWNIGEINVLMEPRIKNGRKKPPRDIEMKNLFGKKKNIILATPLDKDDVFPDTFEFKNIYFVSLKNKVIYPTREKEVFFSYLCNKVKDGWYIGKNKYKDGFYFRKTYQQNPYNFAKKLFEKYLIPFDGNLFFTNKMNERLIKTENPFNVTKEEFEEEFEEKFKGLIVLKV